MKKITSLLAVGFVAIGAAFAQGAQVAGMQFAQNQKNYNNRQVMVTGVTVTFENSGAPGHHPAGSQILNVSIKEKPEWTTCVFMSNSMANQLKSKAGAQGSITVSLSLKGDASRGYQATMFK